MMKFKKIVWYDDVVLKQMLFYTAGASMGRSRTAL